MKRPVRAEQLSIEAWTRQAQTSGMGTYAIETLVKMFRYYDHHDFLGNSRVLANLIRRVPSTFEAFIERTIREGPRL